jgi:hypothetical protein
VAKRNAFDLDLLNELSLAYGEFEADSEARVAVVFGHGEQGWIWSVPARPWLTAGRHRPAAAIRGGCSPAPG